MVKTSLIQALFVVLAQSAAQVALAAPIADAGTNGSVDIRHASPVYPELFVNNGGPGPTSFSAFGTSGPPIGSSIGGPGFLKAWG